MTAEKLSTPYIPRLEMVKVLPPARVSEETVIV